MVRGVERRDHHHPAFQGVVHNAGDVVLGVNVVAVGELGKGRGAVRERFGVGHVPAGVNRPRTSDIGSQAPISTNEHGRQVEHII